MESKTITLNEAISSYTGFAEKYVMLCNGHSVDKLKHEYTLFSSSYYSLKKNKAISLYLKNIKEDWYFPNNEEVTIEYTQESQIQAFVHILIEKVIGKTMPLDFTKYEPKMFFNLQEGLSKIYFIPKSNYVVTYISLIDNHQIEKSQDVQETTCIGVAEHEIKIRNFQLDKHKP